MPRLGRVVVPNYPHHVVQRGHNKQVVFAQGADFRYYLSTLEECKALYGVKVYGFRSKINLSPFHSPAC
jgi:putative transposase